MWRPQLLGFHLAIVQICMVRSFPTRKSFLLLPYLVGVVAVVVPHPCALISLCLYVPLPPLLVTGRRSRPQIFSQGSRSAACFGMYFDHWRTDLSSHSARTRSAIDGVGPHPPPTRSSEGLLVVCVSAAHPFFTAPRWGAVCTPRGPPRTARARVCHCTACRGAGAARRSTHIAILGRWNPPPHG